MKKLAWMLALAMPFAIASCGDDDPTDITLDATSITLDYGTDKALTASEKNCTWGSDNEFVATVDKDGKVEAKHVGTATITVTKDGASASCKVTVVPTNTNFTLPILNWGASVATVKDAVPSSLTLYSENNDEGATYLSYITSANASGMPIYGYGFVNDALFVSSFSVSPDMDNNLNLYGFLEQYYEEYETTEEDSIIFLDGNNRTDANLQVEYDYDPDKEIVFVSFLPIEHTKANAANNKEGAKKLKAISLEAKK